MPTDVYRVKLTVTGTAPGEVTLELLPYCITNCPPQEQGEWKNLHPWNYLGYNVLTKTYDKTGHLPCEVTICATDTEATMPEEPTADPDCGDLPDPEEPPEPECDCCMAPVPDTIVTDWDHTFWGESLVGTAEALQLQVDFDDMMVDIRDNYGQQICSTAELHPSILYKFGDTSSDIWLFFNPDGAGGYFITCVYRGISGSVGQAVWVQDDPGDQCDNYTEVTFTKTDLGDLEGTIWDWADTLVFTRDCD